MLVDAADQTSHFLDDIMGPTLLGLLSDPDVAEIILNPDGKLWVIPLTGDKRCVGSPVGADQAETMIRVVADSVGIEAKLTTPIVSAMLPHFHARFEGLIPPVVKSPSFSIRKHLSVVLTLDDYVDQGILTRAQAILLKQAISRRMNIVISGVTFSGKTTFCNALINEIAKGRDRLILIEDQPEIMCAVEDVFAMQTTPDITMRDLVKSTMRLNPDRIVIGEVRDGVALDLLKAWGTHGGGVATIHSRSAPHALERLGMLIQEVVTEIPRALIGEAVDLIVQINYEGGVRTVSEIIKVDGYVEGTGYVFEHLPG